MPHLTDLVAIHAHLKAAVVNRDHFVILAAGPGRLALITLAARLVREGATHHELSGGLFQLGSVAGGPVEGVAFLTVPKGKIDRAALYACLAHMAGALGHDMDPDDCTADLFILSEYRDMLTSALLYFASA
ncbi:MAG TPA: hypothetical protein VD866_21630 [Urbifossiella sp.]|nr:hypothetical protein [Urbifossiella sp.]